MKKKITWLLGIAVLGVLLVLILFVIPLRTSEPDTLPLPHPNGYDDLVQAGQMRRGDFLRYKEMSLEELRALLKENEEALQRVALGLSREARVPIQYSEAALEPHMKGLGDIKALAQLVIAKGRLAELSNQPGEAVRYYLEAVRFGHEVRRGGLVMDLLVGVACESMGLNALTGLTSKLEAGPCRDLAQGLESIDLKRAPEKTLFEVEHRWARKTYGLRWAIVRVIKPGLLKEAEKSALEKVRRTDSQRRRLILETAVRAYQLEKGTRPPVLTDLVPAYLKAVPLDPDTGRPMSYPL